MDDISHRRLRPHFLPTRIPGVLLTRSVTSRLPDGSVHEMRASSSPELGIECHDIVTAESGFTAQPSFSSGHTLTRTFSAWRGEVYVLVVDVRRGSPTYLQWQGFFLHARDRRTLVVGPGVACGWQAVSTASEVELGSSESNPVLTNIHWNDATIEADWPLRPVVLATETSESRSFISIPQSKLPRMQGSDLLGEPHGVHSRSQAARSPSRKARQKSRNESDAEKSRQARSSRVRSGEGKTRRHTLRSRSQRRFGSAQRPIMIIGSSGALGRALLRECTSLGTTIGACRDPDVQSLLPIPIRVDVGRPASLREAIRSLRPSLIVNATGISDVDGAGANSWLVQTVNVNAPSLIADEAAGIGAAIIHFCSATVFGGTGERPYRENDPVKPVDQIGRTKLLGTEAICKSNAASMVLRLSWLYSRSESSFVQNIMDLSRYRSQLTLPSDLMGTPTSVDWVAKTLRKILTAANGDYRSWMEEWGGLYHLSMLGYASKVEVADHILSVCRMHGVPLTATCIRGKPLDELPGKVRVPKNCQLDCTKFATTFNVSMLRWQEELRQQVDLMLSERGAAVSEHVTVAADRQVA